MADPVSALIIRYSCICGIERVGLPAPVRAEKEDILAWMKKLTQLLAEDHSRRSPRCFSATLKEVLIPVGEGAQKSDYIGGEIKG